MTAHPFRFTASMPGLDAPGQSQRVWRDKIRRIEHLGFSSVSVSDHLVGGWSMDPIVAMTVAAEATTELRVLSAVFCNDLRHPVLLHRSMANLDAFSGGRVEIGLGAGWLRDDNDAIGIPFDGAGVRIDRLAEAAEIMRLLFGPDPVSYQGKHYQLSAVDGLPKPVGTAPPILIGGGGRKVLELAGQHADIIGINPRLSPDADPLAAVAEMSPANIETKIGWTRAAAVAAGRDDTRLEFMLRMFDVRVRHQGTEHRSTSSHAQKASPEVLATSVAVLHGDVEECVDTLLERRERFGLSYIHLGGNLDAAAPIVARLAGR
ncbi:putative F420-dependent oxidoreductase [Allocatelliglobosispora scoriae]|uniref:Putative F420-dependent oxidoreductase n=1 Tax=Allocatelliglobosispora scoriae TaxID=643052 RepID=A0A841BV52_9ACTN|nr:TIGR03621 family F420-dependent LLM class oxidoreductase [Allocatelliglobosispora scoriae]MBB5872074.1 putative F420-dependent oxidoreductase [Allocatelliglobosispora scoriae]